MKQWLDDYERGVNDGRAEGFFEAKESFIALLKSDGSKADILRFITALDDKEGEE